MSVYAIGDIHGCYDEFRRLLSLIKFNKHQDRLWLVGDLVNRGPDSLAVLRWMYQHDDCITAVLGNHDLHLLAVRQQGVAPQPKDTFTDILNADDAAPLCDWLQHRPLAHYENGCLLVHAGVLPGWDINAVMGYASEAAAMLGGDVWQDFAPQMYGDTPAEWDSSLSGTARWRVIINAMTRLRVCTPRGEMLVKFKGAAESIPTGYLPWFDAPNRQTAAIKIICGHWSALGVVRRDNLLALDSGCFWGGALSAVRLDDDTLFQVEHECC